MVWRSIPHRAELATAEGANDGSASATSPETISAMVIAVLDWLTNLLSSLPIHGREVMVGITLFVGTLVASLALAAFFLTRLPPSYFHPSYDRHPVHDRHWVIHCCGVVVKNVVGVVLVILGIVMSLPGVPGQGVLTILVGVMLVDFPGKRALEYKIIRQPRVLRTVNRLRQAFSKPALVIE